MSAVVILTEAETQDALTDVTGTKLIELAVSAYEALAIVPTIFDAVIYDAVSAVVILTDAETQEALIDVIGTKFIELAVIAFIAQDEVLAYDELAIVPTIFDAVI